MVEATKKGTSMRAKTLLVCGLLAVTAGGCGDSSEDDATPAAATTVATTTSAPKAEYVAEINGLCAELTPKVLDVTGGGHPTSYPIKDFVAELPKLEALFKTFDAKVDTIPAAVADRSAADAFDAFRRLSDAASARLAAAAATGEQDTFDAAFDATLRRFEASSVPKDLAAAGITCPAR